MIQLDIIEIHSLTDYDILQSKISPNYFHNKMLEELKNRIGIKINKIIIEYPYYDSDYLSTFYLFYSKKLRSFDKKGYRIHFLKNKTYFGYITLRPTVNYTKVGKSYLHPSLTLENSAYLLTSVYKANILGQEVEVDSYPWMYQETDIAVCAHVAVWNISRYFGNKYKNYSCVTMGEITDKTNEYLGRKVPSDGLNLIQISNIIHQLGFSPLIIKKMEKKETEFFEEIYSYIESGIPCVGVMTELQHAITLIGHGEVNHKPTLIGQLSTFNFVDSLVAVDDNYFPFIEIHKGNTPGSIAQYSLKDLDFVLVPLYDRMQYGYRAVRNIIDSLLKSKSYNFSDNIVLRIYLTSANSLKREANLNASMNMYLNQIILHMEMPKFIWCVDICTHEEYVDKKTSGRVLIDSTCCSYETSPWLLIHDNQKVVFFKDEMWYTNNITIEPYNMYRNNLRRFEP
ncbi:MAG: hypothetical protein ACYCX2_12095 [Christensenellales bacterium]